MFKLKAVIANGKLQSKIRLAINVPTTQTNSEADRLTGESRT